jgi:hypothetical protein
MGWGVVWGHESAGERCRKPFFCGNMSDEYLRYHTSSNPNASRMAYGPHPAIQLQKRLLLPDLTFKFVHDVYSDAIAVRCITPPFTLTLDGVITWDQIKRHVNAALSAAGTVSECGICCAQQGVCIATVVHNTPAQIATSSRSGTGTEWLNAHIVTAQ